MSKAASVREAWDSWRALPFPRGVADTEIDGVDLATVDTYAAGCIQTYVDRGRLDTERRRILADCVGDLDRVLPKLSGESIKYFTALRDLGRRVLVIGTLLPSLTYSDTLLSG